MSAVTAVRKRSQETKGRARAIGAGAAAVLLVAAWSRSPVMGSGVAVKNIPRKPRVGGSFTATYSYAGDGSPFVTSSTGTCTVSGASQAQFVAAGTCTLTAHATAGVKYAAATGSAQSFAIQP